MSKTTKTCPMPLTHGRLHEVHRFWHEAAEAYQEPDLFNMKLNALIQAVRNVTFIMQSELSKHPDFKDWYHEQRNRLTSVDFMVKLRDARNYVVKQGDLRKKSIARVRVLTHEDNPILSEIVSPTLTLSDLLERYRGCVKNPNPNWDVALEIERNWIVDDFPEREILLIIRDAYFLLHEIIEDWHSMQGLNIDECQSFKSENEKSPNIMDLSQFTSLRISLMDGRKIITKLMALDLPDAMEKQAINRYGIEDDEEKIIIESDWEDDPWGKINFLMKTAQKILKTDKYHHPMFHIFKEGYPIAVHRVTYADRPSKYLVMREMAKEIKRLQSDGFVFISETWNSEIQYDDSGNLIPPDKAKDKVETLTIFIATSDGRNKGYQAVFKRNIIGKIKFEKTTSFDLGENSFLAPFAKIWNNK